MATDQVLNTVTQSLVNVTGAGEIGTSIPPKQVGEFRIPFVTNLRLGPISSYFGGTQFTLLWDEPDTTESISHYNVYTVGELQNNQAPLGPYSTVTSPAIFRVTPSSQGIITFFVQTQLNNGNVSDISRSPSITSRVAPPQIKTGDIQPYTVFPAFGLTTAQTSTSYAPGVAEHVNMIFADATSGAVTVNLPENPFNGQMCIVKKIDTTANTVTISPPTGSIEAGAVLAGGSAGAMTLVYQLFACPGSALGDKTWRIVGKY